MAQELFHSGYSQGQTRGFVFTLACYLLTQLSVAPWDVPQIQAALDSFTRLKITHVGLHRPHATGNRLDV